MSRLVLGGPALGRLPQESINELLSVAREGGIERIDSARGYDDLQKKIGNYLRKKDKFIVNSKVGKAYSFDLTPTEIRKSVEDSLKDLGIERVGTVLIHSLHKSAFTDENISMLKHLQNQGKITRFGYSGDGEDLDAAVKIKEFQDFMFTVNILDQNNLRHESLIGSAREVYFKIPLAQAIWKGLEIRKRLASLKVARLVFNKPALPSTWLDYQRRFNILRDGAPQSDYFAEFLKFALFYGEAKQYVTVGTTSIDHLRSSMRIEGELPNIDQINSYRTRWLEKSEPDWLPHT